MLELDRANPRAWFATPPFPNRSPIPSARLRGKSFLLTSVFLFALVHGLPCRAAAPTGIAASNIEVEGTDIHASTLHSVFDLDGGRDGTYTSNLNFANPGIEKVASPINMKARWEVRGASTGKCNTNASKRRSMGPGESKSMSLGH